MQIKQISDRQNIEGKKKHFVSQKCVASQIEQGNYYSVAK